jgi:DNA repair protein RadC
MKKYNLSEIKLSYSAKIPVSKRARITKSHDAYALFKENWNMDTIELLEEFKVMMLNRANDVIGIWKVSQGGTSGTVVDAKLVFAAALKCNASSIILAHNHPSGNTKPSLADIDLTRKLKAGGELLDISVLDHLILTIEGYYSFADEGKV